MIWIHPILQLLATGLALYVLSLGWIRFKANHLEPNTKPEFSWIEHVKYGKFVHIFWMSGLVLGLYLVKTYWGQNGITNAHYWVGQTMMLCIGGGYATGWVMDNKKQKRKYLPLVHGFFNALAVLLALIQIGTGFSVIRELVL